jgi:hypothetical protein
MNIMVVRQLVLRVLNVVSLITSALWQGRLRAL